MLGNSIITLQALTKTYLLKQMMKHEVIVWHRLETSNPKHCRLSGKKYLCIKIGQEEQTKQFFQEKRKWFMENKFTLAEQKLFFCSWKDINWSAFTDDQLRNQ